MAGLRAYVAFLALSIAAVVGRALLEPALQDRARFLVPLVVVVLAAAAGGRGPALLAAVVGGIGTLLVAAAAPGSEVRAEFLPAVAYVLGVAASILLTERLRLAREAAEAQALRMSEALADRDRALAREGHAREIAERRSRILEAMQEVSLTVTAPTLPPAVAQRLLDIAVETLEAASGAVALIDDDGTTLRMAAMLGYPTSVMERFATIPLDADLWFADVARTGMPAWLEGGAERRAAMPPDAAEVMPPVGGAAAVPLQASGFTYGVVAIGMPEGRLIGPDERAFIGLVARKIGQALDRGRLEEERRTAARAEQERAAQLRAVLATMEDAIAVVAGSRIVVRNPSFDRLVGADARSVDDLAAALGLPGEAFSAEGGPREVALAAGGDSRWLEGRTYAIDAAAGEAGEETLVIIRDVTAARTALAVRDAFVGMLSHELRTPVTVILGTAGILRRRIPDDPPTVELIDDIASESERMNRLIDDLLVLSQPDAPVTHPEPVLVHHIVDRVVAGAARRHPDARISVDTPAGLPPAAGDPTLVEQVVRNLVGNAIKYAGPAPVVRVSAREGRAGIEVAVEDDGPGVPEHEREAIFGIYFRSRTTVGRAGGAGIGLFVCRRLVEAMGGLIGVSAAPGGGARFAFDIPAWAATSADDADEEAEAGGTV